MKLTNEEIEKELRKQLRSWDTHVGISAGEAYINGFKACAKWARDQPKLEIEDTHWIDKCLELSNEIERLKNEIQMLKNIAQI